MIFVERCNPDLNLCLFAFGREYDDVLARWTTQSSTIHKVETINNFRTKLENSGHSGTVEASMLRIEVAASTP